MGLPSFLFSCSVVVHICLIVRSCLSDQVSIRTVREKACHVNELTVYFLSYTLLHCSSGSPLIIFCLAL